MSDEQAAFADRDLIHRVRIDASAYPHLLDAIISFADSPTRLIFRLVSKHFRAYVDRLTTSHLVLDGAISPATPWWPGAVLHNGQSGDGRRLIIRDCVGTPQVVSGIPTSPLRLEYTRVLDVRGTLRYEVINRFAPLSLDTLRMYEYYAAPPGSKGSRKTLFWGESYRLPQLPAARRLVVFTNLESSPWANFSPMLPRHYPPGVRELVVHLTLPSDDWAQLELPPKPPVSLEQVTIILARPDASVGGGGARLRGTGTDVAPEGPTGAPGMIADLVKMLAELGVPSKLVGGECLGERLLDTGILMPMQEAGVQLLTADEMRAALGERDWAIVTREPGDLE